MGLELSERLETIGSLVPKDSVVCDIGCDHALLPIMLVERGICKSAIAMDVNDGPLAKADENISAHGLSDKIKTRISDGFSALYEEETNVSVIAGMGGLLMLDILKKGEEIWKTQEAIILSPHRDETVVREYMTERCFYDTDVWVEEDGHFYCIMRFLPKMAKSANNEKLPDLAMLTERQRLYGLNPSEAYLSKKRESLLAILKKLEDADETDVIMEKKSNIKKMLKTMEESE